MTRSDPAALVDAIESALRGKREVATLAVTCLLARGHLLLEDVPGVGKTTLARALTRSAGLEFKRLQCTADLLPADVLGGNYFDPNRQEFFLRKGAVFTQVLLADEVNRTSPRTQSALLEAMAERQVSIDAETHALEPPFMVVATQNPEDFHGTYPLPESQLDRFLFRLEIGYPDEAVEAALLRERKGDVDMVKAITPVFDSSDVLEVQRQVDEVKLDETVLRYIHALVLRTRRAPFALGLSTRGALALGQACRAFAAVAGRDFVVPEDVRAVAIPLMAHRVRLSATRGGLQDRETAVAAIQDLLDSTEAPV